MASDDEAGPSNKHIKLDTAEPIMDVRDMNKLFPKIDNLEHFPLKVLMNIFTRLDFMDLFNLAENSCRFEKIAKIVLNEKYSREYLIVDETKHKRKAYTEFFERFGSEIKAFQAQNMPKLRDCEETKYWIMSLLKKTNNLEKLSLERFDDYHDEISPLVSENITHLTLRDYNYQVLLEPARFRNLLKLDLKDNNLLFYFEDLGGFLSNHPALECLVLGDKIAKGGHHGNNTIYPFGHLMDVIGTHLKQLKELEYTPIGDNYLAKMWRESFDLYPSEASNAVVEKFVASLKHLEYLGLSSHLEPYIDLNELLRRISSECKSIKHLKLYYIDGDDTELFDIIRSFENIESLALAFTDSGDEIESLVEHLPFLRELDVAMLTEDVDWSFLLVLLRKCTTLEKLTVSGDPNDDDDMEMFRTIEFYDKFIATIQNPNVKLVVKFRDEDIGCISRSEVIWRNKVVHWAGYDQNSSNINLLDLSEKPSSLANAEQPNPFNLILSYLDLKSLHSLSQTSKICSQLVESHVKQHSQQQRTFTITEEFGRSYHGLEVFAEYVTNLRVNIFNSDVTNLQALLAGYHNLIKLYIYTRIDIKPSELVVPQVRLLIFDGPGFECYSDMYEFSVMYPDLETFELKQVADGCFDFRAEEIERRLEFRNLKRFTIKYHDEVQYEAEDLRTIFKGTNTELFLKI